MEELVHGYIIKSVPYLENDAILTLLSKEKGLLSFKARGIMKPSSKNSPSCQLYVYGEYLLQYRQDQGHRLLKTGVVVTMNPTLFYDAKLQLLLALASEGILKIDDIPSFESFRILDIIYTMYDSKLTDFASIVLLLLVIFMRYSGCLLVGDGCVHCGSKKNLVTVSYQDGGFLCEQCNKESRIPPRPTLYLTNFYRVMRCNLERGNELHVDGSVAYALTFDFFSYLETQVGLGMKTKELILTWLQQ